MNLKWETESDDADNSVHVAASAYHDDGLPFYWRVKPTLRKDRIVFVLASDDGLRSDDDEDREFETLAEAQAHCQSQNDQIVAEVLKPVRRGRLMGRDGQRMREESLRDYPDGSLVFETSLSRDQIIRLVLDEYVYWRRWDSAEAIGALSNIIAKITLSRDVEIEVEIQGD